MTENTSPSETGKPRMHSSLRALFGLLLLLPACALCAFNPLGLTINTLLNSLRESAPFRPGDFVGFTNYERLLSDPSLSASLGFTILFVFIRLVVAGIFPLLLVLAVNTLGKKSRLGIRLLLTLPLTFFAPALIVLASSDMRWMWNRNAPEQTFLLIDALAALAVSCGVGLIVYLAVLHHREATEQSWKPYLGTLVALWLVGQLAVAAYALQSFTPLSFGLFPSTTKNLTNLLYRAFGVLNTGSAFALSIVIFSVVALFGVIATLILIISRLQLEYSSPAESPNLPKNRLTTILGWVAIAIGGVAVFLTIVLPLLISLTGMFSWVGATSARAVSLPQVWVNTILPPLVVVFFIQLPVAYICAFGIGAIRPLGRWSEWLLLPFSPWLFVTSLPVAVMRFQNMREADQLDSLLALTPPLLLSVPILVVLTLFFKGQTVNWRSHPDGTSTLRAAFKQLILPSLPLALFLGSLSFLASTQDLFLSMLVRARPESYTASSAIMRFVEASNQPGAQKIISLIGLPVLLILLVVFGVLQIYYLNHLGLKRATVTVEQVE
jgi:hypothetical protein